MKWEKTLKKMSQLRTAGRFCRHHPLVLCLVLFLVILYKYYFGWFTLLVTTSPIFLITGIFLGIILAYGEPNNPEKDHVYKKIDKAHHQNIHDSGKPVAGTSLPILSSREERAAKHSDRKKKIRKISHGTGSSSEPGSSESGGSDTDTIPMLHEFHHLRSASNSSQSSQDGASNDSSVEDGTENHDGNDGNKCEGKENVKIVAWTADDQKNIQKIGCLEIERNQRLENLIARRRKSTDRNLVDSDSSDSLHTIEELSKFNVQIPAVFAPKRNPFDLPYDEDNFPDSAPSALLELVNPFDLQFEQGNESSSTEGANSSHVEPIPFALQPQKSLLRRHESFTAGAPFLSEFWQDTRPSRFRPYFVTEKMANEETTDPILEGEGSEKGGSRASSVQDSDSTSSVTDQESQNDILEDRSNQGPESPFSETVRQAHIAQTAGEVPLGLDIEPPVLISDSSDDDISLSGEHVNGWVEAQASQNLIISQNTLLENHSVMDHPQEIEMISNGFHQMSPHSNDLESTSSSSDTSDDPFEVNSIELSANEVVVTDDTHIPDPVYDSSPSGSEKPAFIGSAIDLAVLQAGSARSFDAEEVAEPGLHSVEQSELGEKGTSEIRGHAIVGHDEDHEGSVSHAVPSVSDQSSQATAAS